MPLEIIEGPPEFYSIVNKDWSVKYVPQLQLKMDAVCELPYTRDDLETIKLLLAIMPPIQSKFTQIKNLIQDLKGFPMIAQYVREHVSKIQHKSLKARLSRAITVALREIVTRYLIGTSECHSQSFSFVDITYKPIYIKLPDMPPLLCNTTSLQNVNYQQGDVQRHMQGIFELACTLHLFQDKVIEALTALREKSLTDSFLKKHLLMTSLRTQKVLQRKMEVFRELAYACGKTPAYVGRVLRSQKPRHPFKDGP